MRRAGSIFLIASLLAATTPAMAVRLGGRPVVTQSAGAARSSWWRKPLRRKAAKALRPAPPAGTIVVSEDLLPEDLLPIEGVPELGDGNEGPFIPGVSESFPMNHLHKRPLSFGERMTDRVARWSSSWPFIIGSTGSVLAWIGLNDVGILHSDPFPNGFATLLLSVATFVFGPIIVKAQQRSDAKRTASEELDHRVNVFAAQKGRESGLAINAVQADVTATKAEVAALRDDMAEVKQLLREPSSPAEPSSPP